MKSVKLSFELLEDRTTPAALSPGYVETPAATGLVKATAMEFAPNGDLWVLEQTGAVKRFTSGQTTASIAGTIQVDSSGERGLLGIAFDPNFAATRQLYLYYSVPGAAHNRVSRFTVSANNTLGSETVVFELGQLSTATNHNGGAIHFGPDGKLFVAVGENANGSNAQTLSNLFGKMLRINADGSMPTDNPYYNTATGNNRAIWALGLRNPYTFSFQAGTGRMFINDVGENAWEEIDEGQPGANYGWPISEGNGSFGTNPFYTYSHPNRPGAITGGAFAGNGYYFADFVDGWIDFLNLSDRSVTQFASGTNLPVDLKAGVDGSLYYLSRGAGSVMHIAPAVDYTPLVESYFTDLLGRAGDPAGVSYYVGLLNSGTTRFQVVQRFLHSDEYYGNQIQAFYQTYLGRPAEPGALSYYTHLLQSGTTLDQVRAAFLGSTEYFNRNGGTNASFLAALYQDVLGRTIDSVGQSGYSAHLAAGQTRGSIALQLLASGEGERLKVTTFYQRLLHRSGEQQGIDFWTSALLGGVAEDSVLANFASSDEYFAIHS